MCVPDLGSDSLRKTLVRNPNAVDTLFTQYRLFEQQQSNSSVWVASIIKARDEILQREQRNEESLQLEAASKGSQLLAQIQRQPKMSDEKVSAHKVIEKNPHEWCPADTMDWARWHVDEEYSTLVQVHILFHSRCLSDPLTPR